MKTCSHRWESDLETKSTLFFGIFEELLRCHWTVFLEFSHCSHISTLEIVQWICLLSTFFLEIIKSFWDFFFFLTCYMWLRLGHQQHNLECRFVWFCFGFFVAKIMLSAVCMHVFFVLTFTSSGFLWDSNKLWQLLLGNCIYVQNYPKNLCFQIFFKKYVRDNEEKNK